MATPKGIFDPIILKKPKAVYVQLKARGGAMRSTLFHRKTGIGA
jgi:hypothetical protein